MAHWWEGQFLCCQNISYVIIRQHVCDVDFCSTGHASEPFPNVGVECFSLKGQRF